jgi:hypothetical protein
MADVADECNAALRKIDYGRIPPPSIAARDAVARARRHTDFEGNRKGYWS